MNVKDSDLYIIGFYIVTSAVPAAHHGDFVGLMAELVWVFFLKILFLLLLTANVSLSLSAGSGEHNRPFLREIWLTSEI